MVTETENKKEMYVKCNHCGDEIYWDTHKKLIRCKCEAVSVDGCEYYIRINGNKGDYQTITK